MLAVMGPKVQGMHIKKELDIFNVTKTFTYKLKVPSMMGKRYRLKSLGRWTQALSWARKDELAISEQRESHGLS